jgi:lanosterol synthase
MSYLYGSRFKAPENELILALRGELYTKPYEQIDWPAQRNNVAEVDVYHPHTRVLNGLFSILSAYESCTIPPLRQAGLAKAYQLVVMEDENTSYQTLGPVSKMMNLICRTVVEGIGSEAWKMHALKRKDFMWIGSDGMRMCGTNGSQLWDIAFISQALVETGLAEEEGVKEHTIRALKWLEESQIQENPPFYLSAYRQRTKGAWPFSTKEQGYTVSDCTGEGLKATLYLQKHLRYVNDYNPKHALNEDLPSYTPQLVNDRRLCDAVDCMLTMQNSSGGFASYEPIRGPAMLEWINPAEVFGTFKRSFNCFS